MSAEDFPSGDKMEEGGEEVHLEISPGYDQPLRTSSSSISRLVRQPSGTVVQMLGNEIVTPSSANLRHTDVLIDGFEVPEVGIPCKFDS